MCGAVFSTSMPSVIEPEQRRHIRACVGLKQAPVKGNAKSWRATVENPTAAGDESSP